LKATLDTSISHTEQFSDDIATPLRKWVNCGHLSLIAVAYPLINPGT